MPQKWMLSMKKADFQSIAQRYQISPILARIMRNRDIIEDEDIRMFLHGDRSSLYDGRLLKDCNKACEILSEKIKQQKSIRVIGDYDIDGVNGTYILQEALKELGAIVDTDIPDRIKEGYGLNKLLVDRAIQDGIDTIITVDNGIAAYDEIAYGVEQGLTVIVTDHHTVPYEDIGCDIVNQTKGKNTSKHHAESTSSYTHSTQHKSTRTYKLPPAHAIINPHQEGCTYPNPNICGAAVAFKMMEALYAYHHVPFTLFDEFMVNVAIATIGDVMDLKDENRIFVKLGLRKLETTTNIGLQSLFKETGLDIQKVKCHHIGFVIGPCINASGRLDTARKALDLLSSKTEIQATTIARELVALNDERKSLTEQGIHEAIEQIEHTTIREDKVLVVYLPHIHESIAGIIAGKIKEQYYKPTFILTKAEHNVKGSGRSIEAYHMYDAMVEISDVFVRFGGHKLAAGFSLREEDIEVMRRRLNENCRLTNDDLQEKVVIDLKLPFAYISAPLIEELHTLEPYGNGNAKPIFAESKIQVIRPKLVGANQNVVKCILKDSNGNTIDAVCFHNAKKFYEDCIENPVRSIAFHPSLNEYNGTTNLQVIITNWQ